MKVPNFEMKEILLRSERMMKTYIFKTIFKTEIKAPNEEEAWEKFVKGLKELHQISLMNWIIRNTKVSKRIFINDPGQGG